MSDVRFEDYSIKVKDAINEKVNLALEECSAEIESEVKRNTRVDTGRTKNSWQHHVDEAANTAHIGSNYENAIWEEFGTGEYALEGNGRKGGWSYADAEGNWHITRGKKPSRAFFNAYLSLKDKVVNRIKEVLGGLG